MEKNPRSQEVLCEIAQAMANANSYLRDYDVRLSGWILETVKEEIQAGKSAAMFFKSRLGGKGQYVHTANFPAEIIKKLPEEFLTELEHSSVYLYTDEDTQKGILKIVFHF